MDKFKEKEIDVRVINLVESNDDINIDMKKICKNYLKKYKKFLVAGLIFFSGAGIYNAVENRKVPISNSTVKPYEVVEALDKNTYSLVDENLENCTLYGASKDNFKDVYDEFIGFRNKIRKTNDEEIIWDFTYKSNEKIEEMLSSAICSKALDAIQVNVNNVEDFKFKGIYKDGKDYVLAFEIKIDRSDNNWYYDEHKTFKYNAVMDSKLSEEAANWYERSQKKELVRDEDFEDALDCLNNFLAGERESALIVDKYYYNHYALDDYDFSKTPGTFSLKVDQPTYRRGKKLGI